MYYYYCNHLVIVKLLDFYHILNKLMAFLLYSLPFLYRRLYFSLVNHWKVDTFVHLNFVYCLYKIVLVNNYVQYCYFIFFTKAYFRILETSLNSQIYSI
jgi:hypothetical protein